MSVVVATRDRPAALERCLTALVWQTARPLEIVVVDDASADADAVGRIVARTLDGFDAGDRDAPVVRVLRGDGRGPARARNMGAREARGAIVGFTDDDCVPGPRWAERLAAACAGGDAAAGITVADPAAGRAAAASQLITRTLQLVSLDPQGGVGFAPTCNLACPGGRHPRAAVRRVLPARRGRGSRLVQPARECRRRAAVRPGGCGRASA